MLAIYSIQGTGVTSPHAGERVTTRGIVTKIAPGRGFYIQDRQGDGDHRTSDGIFVNKGQGDVPRVGDEVEVIGTVAERDGKYAAPASQPVTQLAGGTQVRVLSSGNPLPAAVLIGSGGRKIPSSNAMDTMRFWESLEGMRVRVDQGFAIAPSNLFGDYSLVPDAGRGVEDRTPRGGLRPGPGHNRFERVSLKVWREFNRPTVNVGDAMRAIEGVVSYRSGDYQIFATRQPEVVAASSTAPDVTSLVGTANQVTVASYNVLNLDPKVESADRVESRRSIDDDVGNGRFEALGQQIVNNLRAPDIVALQEIQDNNGAEPGAVVDASKTYETLIAAIRRAGGPTYAWCEIPPEADADGGQPGGNIRNGYLYRPDRVSLVPGSMQRLGTEGDVFARCRKPLVARFRFGDRELAVVNNHLSSRRGSTPWNGTVQPPLEGRAEERLAQAGVLRDWMQRFAVARPDTDMLVCGDFNTFEDSPPLERLGAYPFVNTSVSLPEGEAYDYNFRGVSQLLGHTVVKQNMVDRVETAVVHVNADYADKASDHDPTVIRIRMTPSVVA